MEAAPMARMKICSSKSSAVAVYFLIPVLLLLLLLLPSYSSGEVVCEELPEDLCAFAISRESKRCVLEIKSWKEHGSPEYQCRTSEVVVVEGSGGGGCSTSTEEDHEDTMITTTWSEDWIETEECVRSCGLERSLVGISSDSLLDTRFVRKLCSDACSNNCPNIIDLYSNLAAGEGTSMPDLCNQNVDAVQGSNIRRIMLLSTSNTNVLAPAYSPAPMP